MSINLKNALIKQCTWEICDKIGVSNSEIDEIFDDDVFFYIMETINLHFGFVFDAIPSLIDEVDDEESID